MSDDRFITLIRAVAEQRDTKAFAELFAHFAPRLKAYCLRGGADAATAEEIVQETMLSLWQRAASFDATRASPATWIFAIVRNKRIDRLRRERWPEADPYIGADAPEHESAPDDLLAAAQARAQLAGQLAALPDDQLKVLQMAYFEDRPHSEISASLGLPLGTVKSRIRLALARLRGSMSELPP